MFENENEKGVLIIPSEEEMEKRLLGAISSIFENRMPFFLCVDRLADSNLLKRFVENNNILELDSPLGKIKIMDRIVTQRHKTYLEAILTYPKQLLTDGSFYVEFKPYDLLRHKLDKKNPTDYNTFKKYFKDLKRVGVAISPAKGIEFGFGIIDEYTINENTGLFSVKFSRAISNLWQNENLIEYRELLPLFDNIKNPVISAFVRYLITYSGLQISIENLAQKIALNQIFERSTYYKKMKLIRDSFSPDNNNNELELYKQVGISYDPISDNVAIKREKTIFVHHASGETLTKKIKQKQVVDTSKKQK